MGRRDQLRASGSLPKFHQEYHFYLYLPYRDDTIGDNLAPTIKRILESRKATDIRVGNLEAEDLNRLIANLVKLEESHTVELTDVVHRKAQGNPFFAIQFLRLLVEKGLLSWSPLTFQYERDVDEILNETSISDNVVDLVTAKIGRLGSLEQKALKIASCLA